MGRAVSYGPPHAAGAEFFDFFSPCAIFHLFSVYVALTNIPEGGLLTGFSWEFGVHAYLLQPGPSFFEQVCRCATLAVCVRVCARSEFARHSAARLRDRPR